MNLKLTIGVIMMAAALVIVGTRISKGVILKQNVTGYLKRAADANTIPLALEEITRALDYLEANNMTSGSTAVFWETPDTDIDFWYRNLKASQAELQNLQSESALEKTNVLIKLRETLLDTGEKTKVTVPPGLAVHPNYTLWTFFMLLATILGVTGFGYFAMVIDAKAKKKAAGKAD